MTGKRKRGSILVLGLALFAMFFGAGNLIFPPYLGFKAGEVWEVGFLAFVIVDVGMACVAVFAMSRGDGTIFSVTGLIGHKMGSLINTVIVVCIGPFLAIPRTAATTYEMAVNPLLPELSGGEFVFYLLFFLVVFLLTVRKSAVVDIVGKILTPLMVVVLAYLIIRGILSPLGEIQEKMNLAQAAQEGIVAGYQTMDTLAALVFAIIIISSAAQKGYTGKKEKNRAMIASCAVAGVLLALVYGGLSYLGATVCDLYGEDITQAQLLIQIIRAILGDGGMILLGIVVGLACLTTAIGLVSSSSAYFEDLLGGRVPYKVIVTVITVGSFAIANFGLSTIISIASPVLSLLYPVVVTLIVCALFGEKMRKTYIPQGASCAALLISFCMVLESFGISFEILHFLPLYEMGLAWILPAVLGGFVGFCIPKAKSTV